MISVVFGLIFGQTENIFSLTEFTMPTKHVIFRKMISEFRFQTKQTDPSSLNSVTTTINFFSREDPSLDLNNSITSITSRAVIGAMNILKCNSHIAVLDSKIYVWCSVHPDYYSKTFG